MPGEDGFALAEAEERNYQVEMARACHGRNSLVVLPTGLGKTIVCARVAARHLADGERALVVAPTRPLVDQHAATFREQLPDADVTVVTGRTRPDDRPEEWADADVCVATPQVTRNDVLADRLDPGAWGLLVVDEAHKAVGDHATVPVAEAFRAAGARVLGATASPGSSADTIDEVTDNLGVQHVEARGEWDDDVAPYVNPVSVEWVRVDLPNTLEQAAGTLRELAEGFVEELRDRDLYRSRFVKRAELLELRDRLKERVGGATARDAGQALGLVASALRVLHGVKLVETQSTRAAREYLDELEDDDRIANAPAFRDARRLLEGYMGEHPKMRRCARELEDGLDAEDARGLVFVQTRDTARVLVEALDQRATLDVDPFVGQGGEHGLTPDEQRARVEALREGEVDVLVATSVGEEGLDLPSVDLVVFYEAVASAVRQIQRRGRTGRRSAGRAVVLMARGTSDEAAYWAATKREKRMKRLIRSLQDQAPDEPEPVVRPNPNATADDDNDGPRVLVDHRELNSPIARLLMQRGIDAEPTTVPVGDLVLSKRVVVERKTARDFVDSLVDGRLMDQARTLKRSFDAPVLVVEGDPFDPPRDVDRASVSGAIATLSASFGVPVVTVDDTRQAADVIERTARQEHEDGHGPPKVRHGTGGKSLDEQQRFVVEGLPNVSSTLSRRLLEHFGTPGAVFAADEDELEDVRGIGPNTATAIHEVLHGEPERPWRSATSTSTPAPASATRSGTGPERSGSSRSSATTS
jgi:Fanconi anemia group M protein